ncbi:MAG TPA: nuclear transport factor 2 family protein [Allosphingosinicella sp.]|nr:nuclear transport factor 2 family protein [Allosphingosinicella sp.]
MRTHLIGAAVRGRGARGWRAGWLAAAFVLVALPVLSPAPGAAALAQEEEDSGPVPVPRQLRDAVAGWSATADSDDSDALARLYAPDAWFKAPCARLRTGRAAIAQRWREILAYSPTTVSLRPRSFDLARGRDMALERGRAHLLQNVGGLPYGTNVDYLRVWRRTGATWLIAADMFTPGGPCDEEE